MENGRQPQSATYGASETSADESPAWRLEDLIVSLDDELPTDGDRQCPP